MGSVVRGKITRKDLALWDGKNASSSRPDATGGTVTGLQLNDYVDVLQVFGAGSARTVGTINSAISFIGSTTCCLEFGPGTWTIDSDVTIPSNLTVVVKAGAVFAVSSGITLTINGPLVRESLTWMSGAGTVTNAQGAAALIDIKDTGANFAATNVEDALAELASTSNSEGASIIGVEDSAGNFTGTDVESVLTEIFSGALQNVVEDTTPQLGGSLDGQGNNVNDINSLFFSEQAAADADVAGDGQFWVRNDTPQVPCFTNEDSTTVVVHPGISEIDEENGNYGFVIGDIGRTKRKASGGAGETYTIPANGSVAFPVGTLLGIQNDGGGSLTIAITTDTLIWAADNSTGSRTLADGGWAVLQKVSTTSWKIGGDGLS